MTSKTVYLAGKIEAHCWRGGIFPVHLNYDELVAGPDGLLRHRNPPVADGFRYGGPYFVSCDHRCSHGEDSHGLAEGCNSYPERDKSSVVRSCKAWIDAADVVFAWIDDPSAYGSLVEIGYAVARGKPVYLYLPESGDWQHHLWFSTLMVYHSSQALNSRLAWQDFKHRFQTPPMPPASPSQAQVSQLSPTIGGNQ